MKTSLRRVSPATQMSATRDTRHATRDTQHAILPLTRVTFSCFFAQTCRDKSRMPSTLFGRLSGIIFAAALAVLACDVRADEAPVPPPPEATQPVHEMLLAEIRLITAGDAPVAEQHREIALLVAREIVLLRDAAPAVIAALAAAVDADLLPVIAAAAIVAAGYQSPAMYDAILGAAGTTPELRTIITRTARTPSTALDARTLATLPVMPLPPPVLPAPAPSDMHVGDVPLEVYERPVGVAEPAPAPPPRPPAPKYRGQ